MNNQSEKIKGYRKLDHNEIALINDIKALAENCGHIINQLENNEHIDKRCVALAKNNLQQGFMWMTRSVAKPEGF